MEGTPTHYSSINRDVILTPEQGDVCLVRHGNVADLRKGFSVHIPRDTQFAVYGAKRTLYGMRFFDCVTGKRVVREERSLEDSLTPVGLLDDSANQSWLGIQVASVRNPMVVKDFYGLEMRILFDGKWSFGVVIFRDGLEAPRHYHDVTELIQIPWGRINVYSEGQGWREFRENSAVYIPERRVHAWGCLMPDEHPLTLGPRSCVSRLSDEERRMYGISESEASDIQAIMCFAYDGYLSRPFPSARNARSKQVKQEKDLLLRHSVDRIRERVG